VIGTDSLRLDFLTPSQKEEVEGKTAFEGTSNSAWLSDIKLSRESREVMRNKVKSCEIKRIKRTPILTINMNNKHSSYEDTRGIYQKNQLKKKDHEFFNVIKNNVDYV